MTRSRPATCFGQRTEKDMFPDATPRTSRLRTAEIQDRPPGLGLQAMMERMKGKGDDAGGQQEWSRPCADFISRRGSWPAALAGIGRPERSQLARPSRRGADRTDVVLPGRKREGWTLHIVLDTSGSMAEEIPHALGAIADFCEAMGVEQVHLIQCDTAVGSDEVVTPAEVRTGTSPATAAAT